MDPQQRPPDLDANGKPITTAARPPDLDANGKPIAAAATGSPWEHPIANAWEGVKTSLNKLNPFAEGPSREQQNDATMQALKQPRQPFGSPANMGRALYKGVTSITPQQIGEGATDLGMMYAGGKLAGAVSPETISGVGNAAGRGIEAVGKGAEWLGDNTMKGSAPAAMLGAATSHTGTGMAIAAAPVVAKFGGKGLRLVGKAMQSEPPLPVDRFMPNTSGVPDQGIPQGEMPQPTPPVAVDRYMPNTSGTPDGSVAPGPLPGTELAPAAVQPVKPSTSPAAHESLHDQGLRVMNESYRAERAKPEHQARVKGLRDAMHARFQQSRDAAAAAEGWAPSEPFDGDNAVQSPHPPKPAAPLAPVKVQPDDAGPAAMQAAREKYGSVRDAAAALKTDPNALADATEGPRGVLKDPKAIARIAAAVEKIPPAKRAAEAATTNNPKFRDALLASLAAAGVKPELDD